MYLVPMYVCNNFDLSTTILSFLPCNDTSRSPERAIITILQIGMGKLAKFPSQSVME